ncbi:hypothetical protein ZOSMA_256G00080 [Zostera marina]|uniref:non-specific serine/threonine protein kinase n=1 Tax=Zostera marina TaxID=29655 RepID=A0A0K9PHY3_ZOSMR|nr:hypothetical protein ZOSMA_256G00080 [Zostera marina]
MINPSLLLRPLTKSIIHQMVRLLLLLLFIVPVSANGGGVFFNGFTGVGGVNLSLAGTAKITSDGLLQLTTKKTHVKGSAFHPLPFRFKDPTSGKIVSFSSTFVFAVRSKFKQLSGNGIVFAISPTINLSGDTGSQFFGIVKDTDLGKPTNRLFFVELDTIDNQEFGDINNNHVGFDINTIRSNSSITAGYYTDGGRRFENLTLVSGDPMQVWVDYDGVTMRMEVTLAPINLSKPAVPLLSSTINLTDIINDDMYVGFSSATGSFLTSHYILGWSFQLNGNTRDLEISTLPKLPPKSINGGRRNLLAVWISVGVTVFVLALLSGVVFTVTRRKKFAQVYEDWEKEYESCRFSYKELYKTTRGFRTSSLIGVGGFGRVYKGMLPRSKLDVAVKRIPHESMQNMKDFISEVVSMCQLRHRNIIRQHGYSRRKGELLLVYDFMPNGGLDKYLFQHETPSSSYRASLHWNQRFHIIKGVAAGLYYLHEEWEKVVIHRDIKASNVLLDQDFNAHVSDFGLARLYDHGSTSMTTKAIGSVGYMAPELATTGRITKATDVFSFGIFLLEVVCGRRPLEVELAEEKRVLVDWVLENGKRGKIVDTVDSRINLTEQGNKVIEEVELVLNLGLLCSNPLATERPNMGHVIEILEGIAPVPDLSEIFNTDA